MRRAALALALLLAAEGARAQGRWPPADAREARSDAARARHLAFASTLPARFLDLFSMTATRAQRDALRREALAAADRALARTPDDPRLLATAAELRERLGDLRGALRDGARALELAPESPESSDLHFTLALVHTHLGEHEATRDEYLAALRFPLPERTRGTVLGNLADTWLVLGDTARAVETYTDCLRYAPDYALGWLGLAIAQDRDGADPTDAAARAVRLAAQQADGSPGAILDELQREGVFFVPTFDRYTYEAMAHEALARMYARGGELGEDPVRAQQHRVYARFAWEAWSAQAPADDRWRPRVARHLRAVGDAVLPVIARPR